MGILVARIGDIVNSICCCHSSCRGTIGVFVSSADTVFAESKMIVRIGDIIINSCGHVSIVISGSSSVLAENKFVSRLGDITTGCPIGTIISSASTVFAG